MLFVGKKAPHFKTKGVLKGEIKDFSLNDFDGKYKVLFFYPLDFTFVCPTEMHAFQQKLAEFKEKNVEVLAVSVDSHYSHLAWLTTPKNKGGVEGVEYPVLSDLNKSISRDYGVLDEESGLAFRGLFLLDKNNVIQHMTVNNLGLGRNVCEALRMVDALQHHEKYGEVCPANWNSGDKAMKPTIDGLKGYFG